MAKTGGRDLGIDRPRDGMAGLNLHSGENGLFGREKIDEIIPAIEAARIQDIDADGPGPPDTVFSLSSLLNAIGCAARLAAGRKEKRV